MLKSFKGELWNDFAETEMLIGKENVKLLSEKNVAVFGLGGVGGYVAEALARGGVGKLYVG